MHLIEIKNLCHRFSDGTLGLDHVNMKVREGEFVVIAGRNGSGKTTLLRHLNGLLLPDSGEVKLAGFSVPDDPVRARQMVGMVFQDADSQIIGETVYDDVAFGPENMCLERSEINRRVAMALEAGDLTHLADRRPHMLSGGEKRRLAIAGILAMNSKIVVFDEPFSNLDYPGVKQVLKQILYLHQSGRTILVTTHDLEKVLAHADRLIIMADGKIVRDGLPDKMVLEVESFGVRQPYASRMGMELGSWLS
jgi:biotin transport system ATP-binding protein